MPEWLNYGRLGDTKNSNVSQEDAEFALFPEAIINVLVRRVPA